MPHFVTTYLARTRTLLSEWMGEQCRPGGVRYPVGLWGWLCKLNLTLRIGRKGNARGSIGYLQRAYLRSSPSYSRPTRAKPSSHRVSQGESPRARSTSTPAASSACSPTPRSSPRAAASGTHATSSTAPSPSSRALKSSGTGTAWSEEAPLATLHLPLAVLHAVQGDRAQGSTRIISTNSSPPRQYRCRISLS